MRYSLDKYKFYSYVNPNGSKQITAISTYGGKSVKGYAKCHENDEFSEEKGQKLAAARCNEKIATKRKARAEAKVAEARRLFAEAERYLDRMYDYLTDATVDLALAKDEVNDILESM